VSPGAFLPLLGLLLLAGGGVFVVVGLRYRRSGRALERDGVVASAEVLDLAYLRPRPTADPQSGLFHPVVRFRTAAGEEVTATSGTGANPAPVLPGRTVRVRYDPADPRRVELATPLHGTSTLGCLLLGVGSALAGCGVLLTGLGVLLAGVLP
jgi:hypothetical protein